MNRLFIFVMVILSATPVIAKETREKCTDEIYETIGQHLKIENFSPRDVKDVIVAESCRAWPYKDHLMLAAFAYDEGIEDQKSLVVAIINQKNMRVVAIHKSVIEEDATIQVGGGSLRLDTSKFQLSRHSRSLGLRFESAVGPPSCAEGSSWDQLILYVQESKQLRPVFARHMQEVSTDGCIRARKENDTTEYKKTTLSIAKTQSHGFFDLILTTTVESESKGISAKKKTLRDLAMYNGKEYVH